MTMRKLATICPKSEEELTTEITLEPNTPLPSIDPEDKERDVIKEIDDICKDVNLMAKEANLKKEITSAIKEELAAESIYSSAKQRVKEARKAYQEFLTQYQKEISLPLLQEMINR